MSKQEELINIIKKINKPKNPSFNNAIKVLLNSRLKMRSKLHILKVIFKAKK